MNDRGEMHGRNAGCWGEREGTHAPFIFSRPDMDTPTALTSSCGLPDLYLQPRDFTTRNAGSSNCTHSALIEFNSCVRLYDKCVRFECWNSSVCNIRVYTTKYVGAPQVLHI